MKILNIPGMRSAGEGTKARVLREAFPKAEVISPDIPITAPEAMALLGEIVERERPDVVVGTSMGAMLAQKLRGVPKVLANPAFHVSQIMRQNIGTVEFCKPRKDGATHYEITTQMCDEYEALEATQFDGLDDTERRITFGLFGDNDDVVDCRQEFLDNYGPYATFPGTHRFTAADIRRYIVPLILKALETK